MLTSRSSGLFIMICWGVTDWVRRKHLPAALLPVASVILLVVLTLATHRQLGFWDDNYTMWSHALDVTKNNWVAEDMVAGLLASQGKTDEALAHYQAALVILPNDPGANLSIAINLQGRGNPAEAIRYYKVAISGMDDPLEQAKAYQNMAVAYRDMGDHTDSVDSFRESVVCVRKRSARLTDLTSQTPIVAPPAAIRSCRNH